MKRLLILIIFIGCNVEKSQNININDLKNFASSDDAKNLGKNVINTFLDIGQSQLNKARKRVNK